MQNTVATIQDNNSVLANEGGNESPAVKANRAKQIATRNINIVVMFCCLNYSIGRSYLEYYFKNFIFFFLINI